MANTMENNIDEKENIIDDTQENRFLSMIVGNDLYGVEISVVHQIIGITNITEIPKNPEYVKGIINLRGEIIPVIDIRLRFGMEEIPYDSETCIVIIEDKGQSIGIIVDSVKDVKFILDSNLEEPPRVKLSATNKFIKNIGRDKEDVVLIIDVDKFLYDGENE